jgi:CBS domain-containing protein
MRGAIRCSDLLRREHELILDVVEAVHALTIRLRQGGKGASALAGAVEFFDGFVHRVHAAREVQGLMPALARRGAAGTGSAATLENEHDEGRRLLVDFRRVAARRHLDAEDLAVVEAYLAFLRRHVAAADATLLPLADGILSAADEAGVETTFERIEREAGGPAAVASLLGLACAVREACRAANRKPASPGHDLAAHVMRPTPATVAPDDTLARAAERMEAHRTRELPVVDGTALVGIVTRADLEPHRGHYEWTLVRSAMTRDPVTVSPATSIKDVAAVLSAHSLNGVPVVEEGRLIGMLSRADLVRLLAGSVPT